MRSHHIVSDFGVTADGDLAITTNSAGADGKSERGNAILDITRKDIEFAD